MCLLAKIGVFLQYGDKRDSGPAYNIFVVHFNKQKDGDDDFITMKGHHIMSNNDKGTQSNITANATKQSTVEQPKTSTEITAAESIKAGQNPAASKSDPPSAMQTKMDVATEIFKRMKRVKGVTRKEIIELFVTEAKLSKAGASTYYQLIKAKVK